MTGTINNRYRILQSLGSGGCGQTFLVEDTHLPSKPYRVIKKLKSVTDVPKYYPIIKERFDREAAVLEELGRNTDRIPTLYAYFNEGDDFYLVQDWIAGKNLRQAVQEHGTFNETQVRYLLTVVLQVLEFVHSRGIIHRDIKPENIMLRTSDGVPVLIDFGAVKEVVTTIVDSHGIPTSTIVIGTPGFMPLEQSAGRPIFASDLYSLGLTAIFLLTGKYPLNLLDQQTGEIVWRKFAPQISEQLAGVLSKSIESNPRERFLNAKAMLQALQPVADSEPTLPRRPQPPPNNPPAQPFIKPPQAGNQPPQFFAPGAAAQVAPPPRPSAAIQRFVIEPDARVKIFLLYVAMRVALAVCFYLLDFLSFQGFQMFFGYPPRIMYWMLNAFLDVLDGVALGSAQYLMLRKRLQLTPAWIAVTAGCMLAASIIQIPFSFIINRGFASISAPFNESATPAVVALLSLFSFSFVASGQAIILQSSGFGMEEYLVVIALMGLFYPLFVAIGQTIILQKRVKFAGLWIVAVFPARVLYSIVFSIFFVSYGSYGRGRPFEGIFISILLGLFIGVAQAVCLLIFQKKEFLMESAITNHPVEQR